MGLAEIEAKILEEAALEVRKIKRTAAEEVARIRAEAEKEAAKIRSEILQETLKLAEEEKLSRLVPTRLAARRALLEEKHRILNEVFFNCSTSVKEEREIEVGKLLYG
jgi:vacuolar-type H+-ATPase subunit E/Vma4